MSVTESFTAPTNRSTVLTTELDALADAAYSAAGPAYDNRSNKDQFGAAELAVDFVSAPGADATMDLFIVRSLDATNYEDGGGSNRPPPTGYLGSFVLRADTAAQRVQTPEFRLPSTKMKFILYNGSGQPCPATGTTVTLFTYNRTVG